jgi:predicted enzyme related to lactoylglutathione lyase
MPRREGYEQGALCWVDYMAADPAGAREFYGRLFGWTFDEPEANGYRLVRQAGEVVGGFGQAPRGLAPSWNTYLSTKDADGLIGQVAALGGTVVFGPFGAGEDGRFLFAVDPVGASVGFWQGHWAEGIVLVDEHGATCGHELWTPDPVAAARFYQELFGGFQAEGRRVTDLPPQWVCFFQAADLPALCRAAEHAGGQVREGRITEGRITEGQIMKSQVSQVAKGPGDGRAVLRDPWGALFGVTASRTAGG